MNTVVLDKTGTLTQGRPELTDFEAINGHENDVLRLVAAVEAQSEHPIAEAIVQGAKTRGLELPPVSRFSAEPGYGIEAEVDGHLVHVGLIVTCVGWKSSSARQKHAPRCWPRTPRARSMPR